MTPLEIGLLIGLGYPAVAIMVARYAWWHDDRRLSSKQSKREEAGLAAFGWAVAWPASAVFVAVMLVSVGLGWLVTAPGPVERRQRRLERARENVARLERELGVTDDDRMAT